jgi:hypothetical protein
LKRLIIRTFAFAVLCGGLLPSLARGPFAADDVKKNDEQAVLQADRSLLQSVAGGNKKAVDGLLDADFTWIDSEGVSSTREQVLQDLGSFAKAAEGNTDIKVFPHGKEGSVFGVQQGGRFERVWVNRAAGWRLLVYQQVPNHAPSTPAYSGSAPAAVDCENPCRSIPYKPTTQANREVIAAFQAMNTAIWHGDADGWAKNIGDDDFGITPGVLVTKANRIAAINKQKETNTKPLPAPLLSARFFDFGDTVVMTAVHQPRTGKPHHFTRVWVKRNAGWELVAGAQTEIQGASAMAAQ